MKLMITSILSLFLGFEEELIYKDNKNWMYKKIYELDELSQNVVILRITSDLDFSQIAKILGKSETYVRVIFYRAKEKLKKLNNKEENII